MNPYEILGLRSKTASPKAVQRAFRRKSMKHHPDRGGNRQDFEAIQKAYAILSDPARREKYDRTGDSTEQAPDLRHAAALQALAAALQKAIQYCHSSGTSPTRVNLVGTMSADLRQQHAAAAEQSLRLRKTLEALDQLGDRFTVREGENYLAAIARTLTTDARRAMEGAEAQTTLLQATLDILARHQFRYDEGTAAVAQPRPLAFVFRTTV